MKLINTYHVPVPVHDSVKGAGFMAVLTEGTVNDFAVYIGITGNLDPDNSEYEINKLIAAWWVAHGGMKINYYAALQYFPTLKESQYRS